MIFICANKDYKNKGFRKDIIGHMVDTAIKEKGTPILLISESNVATIKIYESIGFKNQRKYTYEFLV